MSMPTIELESATLAYTEHGRGRPMLLMHANPGSRHDYDAVIADLAREHRVIAIDWPGYGDSPAPSDPRSASAMFFARVAIELADALSLRDAVVIGNSVGGYAGVRLALERPHAVGALVLVDSGGFTLPSLVSRNFCRIKGTEWIARAIATRFAQRYLHVRNDHTRAILARTDEGRRIPSRVAIDAAVWRSFNHPDHDLRDRAKDVRVPTLLAWGQHDPVLPLADAKRAHQEIAGSELVVFDTGHMPFAEAPSAFLDAVRAFLAEQDRKAA